MHLFKLLFEHDMLLEQLSAPGDVHKPAKESSLEDFMKPVPTYSRFYLTATRLGDDPKFGLNVLPDFRQLVYDLQIALDAKYWLRSDGKSERDLWTLLETATTDQALVGVMNDGFVCPLPGLTNRQGLREQMAELLENLDAGHVALFLEKAHHGVDFHLFSKKNRYPELFHAFKPHIRPDWRFFSINGKRARSERLFQFETWTLDRPPHGFEEVFRDTRL